MPTYGRSSQPRPTAGTEIAHLNEVVEDLQDEIISQHDTHCDQHEHLKKLNEKLKDQINVQDFHHSQEIDRLNREIRDLASHVEDECIAHAKETEDLIWVVEMLQTQIMGQTEQIDTMKIEHEKEKAAAETAHSVQMDDNHDEWCKLITIQASAHSDETHRLKRKVKQSEYHFRAQAGTTENLEKVIEVLNDKVVAQDKTHRDEMNSIRASQVEEKDARRKLDDEVLDILKDQHAKEMETFRDWHYERVNGVRKENKGRMDGIKAEHDKEATIIWAMHDERLQTIRARDDEEIGMIKGEQEEIEHANKRFEGAESKENDGEDALDFVEDESEDAEQSGEDEWDVVDTSL